MHPLQNAAPSTPTLALLARYRRVVPVQGDPGEWNRQDRYKDAFAQMKRPLRDDDLRTMLQQGSWLACPARRDGITDRIGFDLDCAGVFDRRRRDALYWSVRRIFGPDRTPLVYGTPSGHGLRVYYAIPHVELARLVTGRDSGLVADVLRAEALPVRAGILEISPQRSQVDRLPLGRRMPLLDPTTLQPIPNADIGDSFDAHALDGALSVMERWLDAPCNDLVAHLESLPRATRPLIIRPRGAGPAEQGFLRTATGVGPSRGVRRLVQHGLMGPHSRYQAEWLVAIAMLLEPVLFADLGLTNPGDDEQVAGVLAHWLAKRANGHSEEWTETVRKHRSPAAARQAWVARYLARGATSGVHLIDRVRRAVEALDGSLRRTFLMSGQERVALMALAEASGRTTSALFRAEVWLASYQRAVKSIIDYRDRRGLLADGRDHAGHSTVVIPIAARWMEAWQFGKGRYPEYRGLLEKAGRLRLARSSPTAGVFRRGAHPPEDLVYQAKEYEVCLPEMDLLVRDVGVDPRTLKRAVADLQPTMSGRPLSLDTAHHVLWLFRSGASLRKRYGSRLGRSIEAIGAELEVRLAPQCARLDALRGLAEVPTVASRLGAAA